jgi:hypothetical protein
MTPPDAQGPVAMSGGDLSGLYRDYIACLNKQD